MPHPVAFDADTHTYVHPETGRRYRSVTTILARLGLTDPTWWTDEARERGSRIHRASVHAGTPLLPGDAGYLEALCAFEREAGLEPLAVETPLADPMYDLAGTPDRIGYVAALPFASARSRRLVASSTPGERTRRYLAIVDYKTGPPAPSYALQLGGYEHLARVNAVGGSAAAGYPIVPMGVYLRPDGTFTPRIYASRVREFLILASAAAILDAAQNGGFA